MNEDIKTEILESHDAALVEIDRLRAELAAAREALEAAYNWPRLAHFDEYEPVGTGSVWDRDVKPKLEKALAAISREEKS